MKREMKPGLSFGRNLRVLMAKEGYSFKDVSRMAKVALETAYRLIERKSPKYPTEPSLRVGKAFGFTEKQIRDKLRKDRLRDKRVYSERERFYRLISELIDVFESQKN